jgi:hypothetical protein
MKITCRQVASPSQSVLGMCIDPLVAFSDIHGRKLDVLVCSSVNTTWDKEVNFNNNSYRWTD